MAKRPEELEIFVEHLMDFRNLWTVYNDHLTGKYVPSVDVGGKPSRTGMYVTLMFHLYASLYALIDESEEGLNALRIWRKHFPRGGGCDCRRRTTDRAIQKRHPAISEPPRMPRKPNSKP